MIRKNFPYSITCICLGFLFSIVFSEHLYLLNKVDRLISWESVYLKKESIFPLSQLQGQAQKASQQEVVSNRPECAKDRYSVEEIQKDIDTILTDAYQLEPYSGRQEEWRGIPLEGLPLGHVNYFFKADEVLSEDVDVSRCRTAPCVFNTIYGESEEHIYGYVAFLFFLRTDYVLSGTVHNPDHNIDVSSFDDLSSFSFKEKEFYWIWLWLQSTSENMFHLETLQNVYRLPHGLQVASGESGICGRASRDGWIWIGDECLIRQRAYSYSDKEWWNEGELTRDVRSEAIESFAHEMAHHYDFSNRGEELFYGSHSIGFSSLSNWSKTEYINNGLLEIRWQYSEGQGPDGFVSDYAGKKPEEDFAESLAAFRYYPQTLKEAAPRKFEYFKQEVFSGISYDQEGINEFLNSEMLLLIQLEKRQWLSACLLAQPGDKYAGSFTPLAFDQEVRQEFINHGLNVEVFDCFMLNMDQAVKALLAEFKFENFEGCSLLSDREKDWWHEAVFRREVPSLIEALDDAERTKQVALQVQAFRNQFKRNFNGDEIAIDCYREESSDELPSAELPSAELPSAELLSAELSSAEQCFDSKLDFYIGRTIRDYLMLDDVTLSTEIERLNSVYIYSRFHQEAKNRVKRVMQISSLGMTRKAGELVDSCSNSSQSYSDEENLYSPYGGVDTITLRPWFLNCLNRNYRETLVDLLEKSRGGYITLDREFQRFIYGIQSGDFLSTLDTSIQSFIDQEEYTVRLEALKQETLNSLKGDSSWYMARHLEESHLDACLRRTRQLIDAHTSNMIFSSIQSLQAEICSELQEEEPYKSLFSKGLISFHGDVFSEYWEIISGQWDIAMQECNSRQLCLSLKIIPVLHRSWEMLGESVTAQYTKQERRRLIRTMLLRIKNLF